MQTQVSSGKKDHQITIIYQGTGKGTTQNVEDFFNEPRITFSNHQSLE